jgi:hypothetical protein
MSGIFSIFNAKVTIYRDTGAGAPAGSALFECKVVNAIAHSVKANLDFIPHAGSPTEEISVGNERYSLQLEKAVESQGRDLILTNCMYYIVVEVWTDDRAEWSQYICKRCRRGDANINHAVPTMASATFQCESITKADV